MCGTKLCNYQTLKINACSREERFNAPSGALAPLFFRFATAVTALNNSHTDVCKSNVSVPATNYKVN